MADIEHIERVELRAVWPHEAYDFSVWMAENLDTLNESLGLQLSEAVTEQSAGSFSVDLLADDAVLGTVIIENQLESSNHDHLGKVITYLVAMDAKAAIWVVKDARPEHIAAIGWLNESAAADFYLVKVEAIRIGNSNPAPLFTKIVGPSETSKSIGQSKQRTAERYSLRRQFFEDLLAQAKKQTPLHANISANDGTWVGVTVGFRGMSWVYRIKKNATAVGLWIDLGPGMESANAAVMEWLLSHKTSIETAFGEPITWQADTDKGNRSRQLIAIVDTRGYAADIADWPAIHEKTVAAMIRFHEAIDPFLKQMPSTLLEANAQDHATFGTDSVQG